MTATLPDEVQAVFDRFRIAEYTAIDAAGQPITWPVKPSYTRGAPCIDVRTDAAHSKKAEAARANALVALLFSEPKESGVTEPRMVLVQGSAGVDPGGEEICVHVRPERVYVWPGGGIDEEPVIYDSHMEEVRSGHSEEPERFHAEPAGGGASDHPRLAEIGRRHTTGVLSLVCPDGFPFSIRAPVAFDRERGMVRLAAEPAGTPLQPGLACLTVHATGAELDWEHSFHVRGDLVEVADGWALVPHQVLDGGELEALAV